MTTPRKAVWQMTRDEFVRFKQVGEWEPSLGDIVDYHGQRYEVGFVRYGNEWPEGVYYDGGWPTVVDTVKLQNRETGDVIQSVNVRDVTVIQRAVDIALWHGIHRNRVRTAIARRNHVPMEVLVEYPDLAQAAGLKVTEYVQEGLFDAAR